LYCTSVVLVERENSLRGKTKNADGTVLTGGSKHLGVGTDPQVEDLADMILKGKELVRPRI
jgi:hypothetical protein